MKQPTEANVLAAHDTACERGKKVIEELYPDLFKKEFYTGDEVFKLPECTIVYDISTKQRYIRSKIYKTGGLREKCVIYCDRNNMPQEVYTKEQFFYGKYRIEK